MCQYVMPCLALVALGMSEPTSTCSGSQEKVLGWMICMCRWPSLSCQLVACSILCTVVVALSVVPRCLVCVWSHGSVSFPVVPGICALASLYCACGGVYYGWCGLVVLYFGVVVGVLRVSPESSHPLCGERWRRGPATQAWREEASVVLDWLVCGGDGCVGTFPALTVRSVAVLLRVSRGFRSSL